MLGVSVAGEAERKANTQVEKGGGDSNRPARIRCTNWIAQSRPRGKFHFQPQSATPEPQSAVAPWSRRARCGVAFKWAQRPSLLLPDQSLWHLTSVRASHRRAEKLRGWRPKLVLPRAPPPAAAPRDPSPLSSISVSPPTTMGGYAAPNELICILCLRRRVTPKCTPTFWHPLSRPFPRCQASIYEHVIFNPLFLATTRSQIMHSWLFLASSLMCNKVLCYIFTEFLAKKLISRVDIF